MNRRWGLNFKVYSKKLDNKSVLHCLPAVFFKLNVLRSSCSLKAFMLQIRRLLVLC